VKLADGRLWKNLTIPEKAKVAETTDEFRAAHKYNFLDDNVRAFQTPRCRSSCSGMTTRSPTTGRPRKCSRQPTRYATINLLAARAARAFHEMYPLRESIVEPGRVYRVLNYGPHLDVFMLDERSYRGPNGPTCKQHTARTPIFSDPTSCHG